MIFFNNIYFIRIFINVLSLHKNTVIFLLLHDFVGHEPQNAYKSVMFNVLLENDLKTDKIVALTVSIEYLFF